MDEIWIYLPRIAIFPAGNRSRSITSARPHSGRAGMAPAALQELKASSPTLNRLTAQDSASVARFGASEARLGEHATKLAEVPSTAQIVAAMEQLLSKTMSSLDDRPDHSGALYRGT